MTAEHPFDDRTAEQLRRRMAELIERWHLPGLAVAVVVAGEPAFVGTAGFAEVESGTPLTPGHRQRIASITKTWTALAVMGQVEEGSLRLDDEVAALLPEVTFHGPSAGMTVEHLLTHTSGIGEAPSEDRLAAEFDGSAVGSPPRTLEERYPDGITVELPPGKNWVYANHGYALLGEIVARLDGMAFDEVLARRVLRPLGMECSDVRDAPHPDLTAGYRRPPSAEVRQLLELVERAPPVDEPTVDGANIRNEFRHFYGAEGGGQATLDDMTRYLSCLLAEGEGVVSRGAFAAMLQPRWAPHPAVPGQALGFALQRRFGRASFGHGGHILGGWLSDLCVFPGDRLATQVHLNVDLDDWRPKVLQPLVATLFGDASWPRRSSDVDGRVLASAPGRWVSPGGPLTSFRTATGTGPLTVEAVDGSSLRLTARRGRWKEGVDLVPVSDDDPALFRLDEPGVADPASVAFVGDDGEVTGLVLGDPHVCVRADAG